jgi:hypothetical protein
MIFFSSSSSTTVRRANHVRIAASLQAAPAGIGRQEWRRDVGQEVFLGNSYFEFSPDAIGSYFWIVQ